MQTIKSLIPHVLTMLVTLGVTSVWFSVNTRSRREPVLTQIRGPKQPQQPVQAPPTQAPIAQPAPVAIPPEILQQADADEQINIRVYAAVNRGVVNITTSTEMRGFFSDETSTGTGSGFVIDKQGIILTNAHVVEGAESGRSAVQVTLFDGSTHEAELVGQDASNDLAVLRIKAAPERLTPLKLGDSSKLAVGQKVLAVGNPFGLERTLTTGIISSLDRSLKTKNGRTIKGIVQTDAAINPGNSGGPLLNTRGEVIGMNTAIISQVGQSSGIGFAVPINSIHRILKSIIEFGRVIRADIGLTRVYKTPDGLMILGMVDGGAAERAGLRQVQVKLTRTGFGIIRQLDPSTADVILAVGGKPVKTVDQLLTEVEAHAPGEVVKITVLRDGKFVDVEVTLGES